MTQNDRLEKKEVFFKESNVYTLNFWATVRVA